MVWLPQETPGEVTVPSGPCPAAAWKLREPQVPALAVMCILLVDRGWAWGSFLGIYTL